MPELPEVEIVRQSLDKKIKEKKVKKVIIRNRNLRFKIPFNFSRYFQNKKIIKVGRFSKYLIIYLSQDNYCLIHLGMSGTIHIIDNKANNKFTNTSFYNSRFLPKKHNHIEIIFNKFKIVYNDPRRFGFFQIIKSSLDLKKRFDHLGPEPFDINFNLSYVYKFFKGKKKDVKNFLLDQKFVSGIGNIYASEILFLSRINPVKKASLLSQKECQKIILNSKKILLKAISKGGSSIKDFKDTSGSIGRFQNEFKVYQQEGKKCKNLGCSNLIKKIIISNRSTFFCDSCQK
ncbi:bifunctional DNA-formamidopyrimidine glycosylase/DNA-(apurinic or apyrimidinic site) lyase [Candidatus Pelagibacter sp.]|jgi:formamidopyrimidine-DNA glycosylase|nr:bifunctional DNA-formamidopyrimidine glycosylase/DNA-(apurinic or apyrimidinic site) lyase [Candidatus Pelagibacter sp.]